MSEVERDSPLAHFQVAEDNRDGVRTLLPRGELDTGSAGALLHRLTAIPRGATQAIRLDLAELEFVDSSGINAILLMREISLERGLRFSIVDGSPKIQRVFELVGLASAIDPRPPG
jgi:anti-anti-sigma factor